MKKIDFIFYLNIKMGYNGSEEYDEIADGILKYKNIDENINFTNYKLLKDNIFTLPKYKMEYKFIYENIKNIIEKKIFISFDIINI